MVQPRLVTLTADTHTDDGRQRRIKEGHPVATELDAESAAGKPGTYRDLPRGIVTFLGPDLLQFLFILVERIIVLDRSPRKLADLGNRRHVHPVSFNPLEFGERIIPVTDVYHQHGKTHVDVQLLFRDSQVSRGTLHVPYNAVGIRQTFNQELSCTQQEVDPAMQQLVVSPDSSLQVFFQCCQFIL